MLPHTLHHEKSSTHTRVRCREIINFSACAHDRAYTSSGAFRDVHARFASCSRVSRPSLFSQMDLHQTNESGPRVSHIYTHPTANTHSFVPLSNPHMHIYTHTRIHPRVFTPKLYLRVARTIRPRGYLSPSLCSPFWIRQNSSPACACIGDFSTFR